MAGNAPKKKRGASSAGVPANSFTEVKDLITQMESFIKEAEALATMELRRIEEIKESLKASVARLATIFREKEESILTRERTTKELEEHLATKIRELENQLRDKESLLLAREEALKAMEVKSPPANVPPRVAQPPEGPSSIRDMEEGLLHRSHPVRRDGETQAGGERASGETDAKGSKPPIREPEIKGGRVDKREAEPTRSRLVSLLGPIKRKS